MLSRAIPLHTSPHLLSEAHAAHEGVDLAHAQPEGLRTGLTIMLSPQEAAELSDQPHHGVELRGRLGRLLAVEHERRLPLDRLEEQLGGQLRQLPPGTGSEFGVVTT